MRRVLSHRVPSAIGFASLSAVLIVVFAWAFSKPRYDSVAVLPFLKLATTTRHNT